MLVRFSIDSQPVAVDADSIVAIVPDMKGNRSLIMLETVNEQAWMLQVDDSPEEACTAWWYAREDSYDEEEELIEVEVDLEDTEEGETDD